MARNDNRDWMMRRERVLPLLLLGLALGHGSVAMGAELGAATEPAWPKQIHAFSSKDFTSRAGYKPPPGIEKRDEQYEPAVTEWDLNGDGISELILSYVHTPGQNKVCYYVFRREQLEYRLIGKIYHCKLVVLEPFNGFGQLEGWVSSSEGVYVRALYQMCGDGAYRNTRMDIYKATRFTDDGGPIESSKIFEQTQHPNMCK
jgi:hypothetical protein